MKTLFAFVLALFASTSLLLGQQTANLQGAYLGKDGDTHILWLFADGYCSQIYYTDDTYKGTSGGPFTYDGKSLRIMVEYNDMAKNGSGIGKELVVPVTKEGENLRAVTSLLVKQASKVQDLDGLWHITGRKQGDKVVQIHQQGTRKTIKLLVDGYFQWMAIDPGAKTFSGTGGGHYTFKNGKYTEHILFFSRDNSRVGAALSFDGEIKDGQWHHSGLSSKGDPIYEIWSRDK